MHIEWGKGVRDRKEGTGRFECPQCASSQQFTLIRTYEHREIYFIAIGAGRLVAERIACDRCAYEFPLTVLGDTPNSLTSAFEATSADPQTPADYSGNVVELTATAARELSRRLAEGQFDADVVVRIELDQEYPTHVIAKFDYPLADGQDWIGQSQEIPIVVDRRVAPQLQGATIDFDDDTFIRF
jgi:Fe-S cluster assembly iron-binding protein IscA